MSKSRSYKEHLHERLKDEANAAAYLNEVFVESLCSNSPGLFQLALKDVIEAQGAKKIIQRTNFIQAHINRILSPKKDITLNEAGVILSGLGFRMEMHADTSIAV